MNELELEAEVTFRNRVIESTGLDWEYIPEGRARGRRCTLLISGTPGLVFRLPSGELRRQTFRGQPGPSASSGARLLPGGRPNRAMRRAIAHGRWAEVISVTYRFACSQVPAGQPELVRVIADEALTRFWARRELRGNSPSPLG